MSILERRLHTFLFFFKVSRKKFQQLAKIFTFQRKKTSSQKPTKSGNSKLLDEFSDDEARSSKK